MQKIHVLDTIVANQIAAGEVVDRPASVIKELVENSIDAGATAIEIEIVQGGTEYLRVTDNGSGMSREDAILALERHATSKIINAEDLQQVQTLGFRGEALPSIASVSKFKLTTRTAEQELAISIVVEGGRVSEIDSCGGNIGTSIVVEELFYNLPARRKFLKSVATETRYINELITKLALSCPHVKFSLKSNDRLAIKTSGNGNLAECIHALFGKEVSQQLLAVGHQGDNISLSGYIGNPGLTKNNRNCQFAFVNNRSVSSKLIYKALDNAYQSKIARGTHAFALLNIDVDTNEVDVNVHPQKQEVKFADESKVFRSVFKALVNALEYPLSEVKTEQQEMLVHPESQSPDESSYKSDTVVNKHVGDISTAKLANTVSAQSGAKPERKFVQPGEQGIWRVDDPEAGIIEYLERKKESCYVDLEEQPMAMQLTQETAVKQETDQEEPLVNSDAQPEQEYLLESAQPSNIPTVIGQFYNKYIIAALDKDLYIIDQHAAHERVIYDGLVAGQKVLLIQELLVAEFVQLLKQEMDLLHEYIDEFAALGLKISVAGSNTVRIESAPASIPAAQLKEFFSYMLARLGSYSKPSVEDFQREVAHSVACKAAIKAGDNMSIAAMQKLLERLYATQNPFTCPHGRPLIVKFSDNELNKMFKRS